MSEWNLHVLRPPCIVTVFLLLLLFSEGGAWLVAYRAEQRRRFKAVLCAGDPSLPTKSLITNFKNEETDTLTDVKSQKLDGFYLVSLNWSINRNYSFKLDQFQKLLLCNKFSCSMCFFCPKSGQHTQQIVNHAFSWKENIASLRSTSFPLEKTSWNLYFFQMKQFHVDDPSDLCSVRISGQELREVQ